MRGAQPRQSDRNKLTDCGLGRQAAGCREGVEGIACQFIRRYIIPEVISSCALDQQVPDEVAELLLRSGDVLADFIGRPTDNEMLKTLFTQQPLCGAMRWECSSGCYGFP